MGREEDRDVDGLMHATPVMGFDLLSKGGRTGRIYISMETRQLPAQKSRSSLAFADTCIKDVAHNDPNTDILVPSSRERMHYDRAHSDRYSDRPNSDRFH